MARPKKVTGDLETISAERERLLAELARLDEAEKAAIESERDAGREALLAALAKVKIPRMDRTEAKAIAQAVGTLGPKAILERLCADK